MLQLQMPPPKLKFVLSFRHLKFDLFGSKDGKRVPCAHTGSCVAKRWRGRIRCAKQNARRDRLAEEQSLRRHVRMLRKARVLRIAVRGRGEARTSEASAKHSGGG
jgi:hypothetical protein